MPRGNGTGPMGMGRMTGRGAGFCAGAAEPGCARPVGFGSRAGYGRGYRRMYNAAGVQQPAYFVHPAYMGTNNAASDEKAFLNNQAEFLENELNKVRMRLSGLKEDSE